MGKKVNLAELLRGFSSGGRQDTHDDKNPDGVTSPPVAAAPAPDTPRTEKQPGILDPIMSQLDTGEKFEFLSGLMDFMADFIVNMLDQYTFELGKVENSISNLQSMVLNQVRTIRNQVDIARQQGHFKEPEGQASPFSIAGMFPGAKLAAAASSVGATEEPKKRREATERDVMDIAASIRTLITRQKIAKQSGSDQSDVATLEAETTIESTSTEPTTEKASLGSKLEQFQKSGDEQKQRIERISSTSKPVTKKSQTPTATIKTAVEKPKATSTAPSSKKTKPVAKPTKAPEKGAPVKLDKSKDIMPKAFQRELLKNIKGMIKEKEKEAKKEGDD